MPEVILPCPDCGGDCLIVAKNYPSGKWHTYCDCGHIGRFYPTRKEAIKAHNALPRALPWTHEPPKVAGWYWMRQQGEIFDLMQHYSQADIDRGFDNEMRLKQWAGPIAPPVEG